MAIWEIPSDMIIDYSSMGDSVNLFSRKVKYCLEEAFVSLRYLRGRLNEIDEFNYKIRHLQRLIENLYLILDVAELNPGGYDSLVIRTFFSEKDNIDLSRTTCIFGDDKFYSGVLVETSEADGATSENVLTSIVSTIVTQPITFGYTAQNEAKTKSHAHLVVKHKNTTSASISADIALYNESEQESFVSMVKIDTHEDSDNSNRATTEFVYSGDAGEIAVLKITFKDGANESFWVDSFACTFDE